MPKHAMNVLSLTICTILAGCATGAGTQPVPGAAIPPSTRHGWISEFYTVETPNKDLPRCLADLAPDELGRRHFVKVEYRHVRRMLIEVAELPEGVDPHAVHIGDHLELIPEDCDSGRISHITKFLP